MRRRKETVIVSFMRDYYEDDSNFDPLVEVERPRYPLRTIFFALILLAALLLGIFYPVVSLFLQPERSRSQPRRHQAPLIDAQAIGQPHPTGISLALEQQVIDQARLTKGNRQRQQAIAVNLIPFSQSKWISRAHVAEASQRLSHYSIAHDRPQDVATPLALLESGLSPGQGPVKDRSGRPLFRRQVAVART